MPKEDYTYLYEIGSGELSKVFVASKKGKKSIENYIIKKISFFSQTQKNNFRNEVEILKTIQEQRNLLQKKEGLQYIVEFVDSFEDNQEGGIVMNYYQDTQRFDQFFTQYIVDKKCVENLDFWMRYYLQIILAVQTLHSIEIFHRDLKLENIIYIPKLDRVVLIDFGAAISLMNETNQSQKNTIVGSHLYQPPEVLLADKSKAEKADIWALGVILSILAFGKHPLFYEKNVRSPLINYNEGKDDLKSRLFQFQQFKITLDLPDTHKATSLIKFILKETYIERPIIDEIKRQLQNTFLFLAAPSHSAAPLAIKAKDILNSALEARNLFYLESTEPPQKGKIDLQYLTQKLCFTRKNLVSYTAIPKIIENGNKGKNDDQYKRILETNFMTSRFSHFLVQSVLRKKINKALGLFKEQNHFLNTIEIEIPENYSIDTDPMIKESEELTKETFDILGEKIGKDFQKYKEQINNLAIKDTFVDFADTLKKYLNELSKYKWQDHQEKITKDISEVNQILQTILDVAKQSKK